MNDSVVVVDISSELFSGALEDRLVPKFVK